MYKAVPSDLDPSRAPSVFDIDVLRVAKVYADALLRAAAPKKVEDQFQVVFDSLVGNPLAARDEQNDVAHLLASEQIPKSKRADIIRTLFDGKVDDLFVNFLLVLDHHNRLDILRPIAMLFRQLRDELHRRVRVQVRSAVPLEPAQKKQLSDLARSKFQLEPVLVEILDPGLLGGFQVQVGDRLVDMSVKSRLETIKHQLIERSSHEIQRRRDRVGSEV
ncbi:MAG: ATP synthase F1 subunit delta [Gemmataceae bacterium]